MPHFNFFLQLGDDNKNNEIALLTFKSSLPMLQPDMSQWKFFSWLKGIQERSIEEPDLSVMGESVVEVKHIGVFSFFFKTDKLTRTQLNKDINYNITFTSIQRRSYRMPFLYRKMVIKQGIFSGHLKSNRNILLTNLNKKGSLSRYVYIYERPFFSLI